MSRLVTVASIIDGARRRADDYDDEALADDTEILSYVEQAYGKYFDLLMTADPAYFQVETNVNTVAGTKTVALPTRYYATLHVDILEGGTIYSNLDRLSVHERLWYQETGKPVRYQIEGGALALYPTPDAVYTIRHVHVPSWVGLTAVDSIDGLLGNEDLLELEVAIRLKDKEEATSVAGLLAQRDLALERLEAKAFQRNVIDAQVVGMDNIILEPLEGDWPRRRRW